ncbi:MAG TPA: hypothetical protein VHE56_00685 [Mycobacteriales bacterium]|nr:hypothetical protein [Mycobacteriales bacterium]
MAAGVVVVATDGSTPVANADTVLGVVKDARISSPSGATRVAVSGERLVNGDVVTTGAHGSAQLITRHRTTYLGGLGALAVLNGGRQKLRHGTAVVDALHGPQLDLVLSGSVVTVFHGSATEAARGPSTRVGALAGPATITSVSGRRLTLTALSQAVLSGDAVPGGTTPLHLTDSPHEFSVVPALVKDDIALKTLARGIDTTGRSTAHVVEASWSGMTQPVPDRVNRSERVLPVLIADSTHGGSAQQRYNSAVAWRAQGGSWGVVLHLLSGRASAVESTLAALQRSNSSPGQIGTVASTVSAAGSGPRPFTTPPVNPHGTHYPSGSGTPPPARTSSPPPPDNLLGGLVATVQNVIDGVLGLLPHDSTTKEPVYTPKSSAEKSSTTSTATKSSTSTATNPVTSVTKKATKSVTKTATPAPTQTPSRGLLGNLLGGLLGHQ